MHALRSKLLSLSLYVSLSLSRPQVVPKDTFSSGRRANIWRVKPSFVGDIDVKFATSNKGQARQSALVSSSAGVISFYVVLLRRSSCCCCATCNRSIMMAPEYYIFTGSEVIPWHITHVYVVNLSAVPAQAFRNHPNIEEVECDAGVEKIEEFAFDNCASLRRVIMPGVKVVGTAAFQQCRRLTYVECGKLERIVAYAFQLCTSLSSIDLPSIKIVEMRAFGCTNLLNVKFGEDLESIGEEALRKCHSLERITLPLKDGLITDDSIFRFCNKLGRVDPVGGVHETVAALLFEEWRNDMNNEIDFINRILAKLSAGNGDDPGGKARAIRRWVRFALRKIVRYKAEHRRYVNEAADRLQLVLPQDIVRNNVLPFLELPSHTFDGEN